jgi:rhodanese-related sulfurtransferase
MDHSPQFLKIVEEARPHIREVDVKAVRGKQDGAESFFLIDVREDHEWAKDHAEGAIHLGKGILERDIEAMVPDLNAEIVLYCGGGFRSVLAARSLQQMGYRNVYSMDGGMRAWREANYPLGGE